MKNRNSTSFGPNSELHLNIDVVGSHRDENFRALYRDTVQSLTDVYGLHDFDLIFIPGGGTVGIESLLASSTYAVEILGVEGVFKSRWTEMSTIYNPIKHQEGKTLSCHLETSNSTFQEIGTDFLDAVSSFPYYSIPSSCEVFVTASNKQLNALAGLAIIGIRKDRNKSIFRNVELSYLSISRYLESAKNFELPSTVGTYLFDSLLKSAISFDKARFFSQIAAICAEFLEILGPDAFIGDLVGPVITIKKDAIPSQILRNWNLYEKSGETPTVQIFTYSSPVHEYEKFLNELRKVVHDEN